ncbi:(2Fe-2S) ferredoxin domain-containing protein [Lichenibacterium dinghuense]|uniref:(2Fe-2S) ferredoxin domain-containing protein n=1 Tax=Lichenibacterium dinghuense TaxID=2895977 RepID=UPI001F25A95B|nr:(2Fe-2S) ferredoxin domain-containing protein [Lichenibacterium sp. 6Y81]
MSRDKAWKRVGAEWRDVVLVCRKCSKKLDGGFGPDGEDAFAKALRRSIDGAGKRKVKARRRAVGVVEVGCLGLCPKRAVVVVKGSAPGSMLLVPEGAGMDEVVDRLGLGAARGPDGPALDAAE